MAETVTVGELLVRLRADVSQLEAGLRTAETGLNTLGTTGGKSRVSMARLQHALRGVAVNAAGLPGPLGRVSNLLLGFAPGGFATSAALAGLGAMALIWQAIAKNAAAAREELERNAKALSELRNLRIGRIQEFLRPAFSEEQRLRAEIAALRARFPVAFQPGVDISAPWFTQAEREAVATVAKLEDALRSLEQPFEQLIEHLEANARRIAELREELKTLGATVVGEGTRPGTFANLLLRSIIDAEERKEVSDVVLSLPNLQRVQDRLIGLMQRAWRQAWRDLDMTQFMRWQIFQEQLTQGFRQLGQSAAQAFFDEFIMTGKVNLGRFFRSLVAAAVNVGITALFTAAGAPVGPSMIVGMGMGTAFGFSQRRPDLASGLTLTLDFANFPPATNPLAAARDRDWQKLLRESASYARASGFRFAE